MSTVYRFFSSTNKLLYIGSTTTFFMRTRQHQYTTPWFGECSRIELEHFDNIREAREAEWYYIDKEKPLYNTVGTGRVSPRQALHRRPRLDPDEELEKFMSKRA
jgi:GIY-YIG catalytic domain-containing protein